MLHKKTTKISDNLSYESHVTLETTNTFGNFSLLGGEMMDLDIQMLNNGKNHEEIPRVEGR